MNANTDTRTTKATTAPKSRRAREQTPQNGYSRAIHVRLPYKTDVIAQALKAELEAAKGREVSWPVFFQHLLLDATAKGGMDLPKGHKAG